MDDAKRLILEKIKICASLSSSQELKGQIYNVQLYSSDIEGENWLYSGIEGYLGLIVDFEVKTKFLCIYDPSNYEKVFQYELYNNFEYYFQSLAPEFRSFEIESGFIGLQFDNQNDAECLERTLLRILAMRNIFQKKIGKENIQNENEIFQKYCKALKNKFCQEENKNDKKNAKDCIKILKQRKLKDLFSFISYDKQKKTFKIGKISDELKEIFVSYGIKKKDLVNDLYFAFNIFQKVILNLGSENKIQKSINQIEHIFPPPEEKEIRRRQEEWAEAKINNKVTKTKRKPPKKTIPDKNYKAAKRNSLPPAPLSPTPLLQPLDINAVPHADNIIANKRISMLPIDSNIQVQNMELKKVFNDEKLDNKNI